MKGRGGWEALLGGDGRWRDGGFARTGGRALEAEGGRGEVDGAEGVVVEDLRGSNFWSANVDAGQSRR